jgi:hypothetical protein
MVMVSSVGLDLDFIQELQLRRWAREHYVPRDQRETSWHPIVHQEMEKKEFETSEPMSIAYNA